VPIGFAVTEPAPADPSWPRYSAHPFPPYRFIPGKNPHPRRDPVGHSYGKPEPTPSAFRHDEWHKSEEYLYGIDLYNFAFWWECHEVFEGLWHAVGHDTEQGNFFQALIQLAAANLKQFLGNHQAAGKLLISGMIRLQKTPRAYMGIDVDGLTENLRRHVADSDFRAPLIRLHEQDLM
jgi:predicted metal-dependent hydrolase